MPFSRRLARENGWSIDRTARVIEEYKRFLYMATRSNRPVTPSDDIDQAWHLHLLYTRHYWNTLCADVLGRPLHHEPTRGGPAESSRYASHYEDTLARYRDTFGHEPPRDIWPAPRQRFANAGHFRRVNLHSWVVLPRIKLANAGLAAIALTLTGCVSWMSAREWKVLGVLALGAVALFLLKRGGGGRCSSSCGGCGGD